MDRSHASRFPQFSWLGFRISCGARPALFRNQIESRCHMIGMTARGSQFVQWISRGREKRWPMSTGTVNFFPCDAAEHTFVLAMEPGLEMPVFLIPDAHVSLCLRTDHCDARPELLQNTFPDDVVLQACLRRLGNPCPSDVDDPGIRHEEAARRLVLRLVELCGGTRPEWQADGGTFDRRTMAGLVDYIDAHLKIAPSLGSMALRVGLSPSHFAKKFRQSTGLSLHRFINLRRVRRALDTLRGNQESISGVSRELGFSSQSHFTRLFSGLSGMTPARYQKRFGRTVG